MIIQENYDTLPIRAQIQLKCDYCGVVFTRIKKSIPKLNTIIQKDSCGNKECTKKKKEEIALKKYGATTFFKSKLFDNKRKSTNVEKYGTEEYFDSQDFQDKRKRTLSEKYGVESPLQSEEIKKKQRETCKTLYGVENYAQAEDFDQKAKATNLKKLGVESPMQNPECLAKRTLTTKNKFGVESYTQTAEYWTRRIETCQEKYGVPHPSQLKENRQKATKTNVERYGVPNYAMTEEFKQRYIKTCLEKYNVPSVLCLQQNRIYGKTQKEIQHWLNSMGFSFKEDYSILDNKELDLYDPQIKLAIEYCGLFWHNELSLTPRFKNYHYNKYIQCLGKNVRLITIFEDEWKYKQEQCKQIICSILGKNKKLHARKCSVVEVDRQEFNAFCDQYHLLGSNNLGQVFYLLQYNQDVVGGMSLGRHPRQTKELTLDRMCFGQYQIVGGVSKLFKRCLQWATDRKFNKIITWSDNRWSQGNVYNQLGFELEKELPPDYSYVDLHHPTIRVSKQSQKKSITGCDKDTTEKEWCAKQGLARIWDCGKKRWSFTL